MLHHIVRGKPTLAPEIDEQPRYHAHPGFARLVVDHLAGMSDRFALEEYRALQLPSPEQEL